MAGHTFPGSSLFGQGANPFGGKSSSPKPSGAGPIQQVIEEDEHDAVASPTAAHFSTNPKGPFGGDASKDAPPSSFKPSSEGFPNNYGMGRRTSVSAESMNPTDSQNDKWTPPYHAKTEDQMQRLQAAVGAHTLFKGLDEEQSRQVIGALVEKPIPTKNIKVCEYAMQLCDRNSRQLWHQ